MVVSSWDEALLQQMAPLPVLFQSSWTWRLLLARETVQLKQQWWECFSAQQQGEKQTPAKRTLHPLTKYSCTNQIKVLTDQIPCGRTGEIIVSHFLATKYNIAATNNNTQRVFNGTHVHFKHESVFTTPLEDKRKVETKASEFVVATKAACSMDEGAQGWRCCWAAMLPCAMGGMRSRPTKQLHN